MGDSNTKAIVSSLPWQEISKIINSHLFAERFSAISTEVLEFTIQEVNYPILVEAAIEALKITNPTKANTEQAAKVADKMKEFASQALTERTSN